MTRPILTAIFTLALMASAIGTQGQKVGLVLSGGGASGLAHIGVIKALEEHEIPIDFITGTSMGALIGGLYASGYSVEELIQFVNDESFLLAVNGALSDKDVYYFTKEMEDASIIRLKLSSLNLQKFIPTNLVTPDLMEYQLMDLVAQASEAAQYDFDQLMIPFRCVAADVMSKEQVIFSGGHLSVALRASSTYPFYFRPIKVGGKLLFDGGLYNNFPSDVMYSEFLPDVIIGSNVATGYDPPEDDDLLSQIRSMIIAQSDFTIQCDYGVIIEPESDVNVFDFSNVNAEVAKGYIAALKKIEEIKLFVDDQRTESDLSDMRIAFRGRFAAKEIGTVTVIGDLSRNQKDYVNSFFGPTKSGDYSFLHFKSQFLRLAQDEKIRHLHPVATFDRDASAFDVQMTLTRERDFTTYFGGNFSSRPINMGYVGLKYNLFGRPSASIMANSYFGKFYGSALLQAKIDFGGQKRFNIIPHVVLNRWDYFRNFSTFFEQSRPSYIVRNEAYGGINAAASWGNNAILKYDIRYGETLDRYYQITNFTAEDTADATRFRMYTSGIGVDRNTLNRKIYPNRGTRLEAGVRGASGREETDYGTTIPQSDSLVTSLRQWIELRVKYENYFLKRKVFTLGGELETMVSGKPNFDNYTASLVSAPAWQPIPESRTIFIEGHRALVYAAAGLKAIIEVRRNLEVRLEGYAMQPYKTLERMEDNQVSFKEGWEDPFFVGAGALVFQSPLGPVSLNLNFYDRREGSPWSFFFNFGYTIFNKSVYQQ